jgi:hypothetical protein
MFKLIFGNQLWLRLSIQANFEFKLKEVVVLTPQLETAAHGGIRTRGAGLLRGSFKVLVRGLSDMFCPQMTMSSCHGGLV